ncbi:MAG TPA: PAS domain-containing protein [Bryobacteraceae bacterium]|jgi:PAS domain S-box-containing protein
MPPNFTSSRLLDSLKADSAEEIADLLGLILSQVGDGIIVINTAREVIFMNDVAAQLLGTSESPSPDADWSSFYGFYLPDTVTPYPMGETPLIQALSGRSCNDGQIYIRSRNVIGNWLSATTRPLRRRDGKICGAVSVFRDITPEKRAAEVLRESEQRFRMLFEDNTVGIVLSSLEGNLLDANEAFARMMGYSRVELRGMRMQQIYHDATSRELMLHNLLSGGTVSDEEIAFRHAEGHPVHVLARIRLLEPTSGGIGGNIIGAVVDISERKRQENALQESERRFEAFMQSLPGGAFVKDSSLRYVYYNQPAQFWKSFPHEPVIGKTDTELFPSETANAFEETDRQVLENGSHIDRVQSFTFVGGNCTILVKKFPILDDSGKPHMIGGVLIDITDQHRLEEQLRLAQKMEAIGRLAGGVAHDFNNLLTIISGYAHMLQSGLSQGRVSSSFPDFANEIVKATERAAALTGQLLVFSRKQVIQPVVLNLIETVQGLSKMLRRTLGENIEIAIEVPRFPCWVKADSGQMEQLILNLAINARDAMPQGGRLRIRLAKVQRAKGRCALLEFSDTGRGLDETTRERMFEPYFSAKNPAKFGGLGLSAVYGIVKQNLGEIEVTSPEGAGSTFRIFLPLVNSPTPLRVEPKRAKPLPKGTETILLVEDEEGVRNLVSSMLRGQGYRVYEAEHGWHALEVFANHESEIQLLLTDVIMPKMSGRELAERLMAKSPSLKVIYMSGYTDDIVAREGVVFDNTILLHKPFTLEGLTRKLREALGA